MTTQDKLEQIKNRSTAYELVCLAGKYYYLAGYTRKSKMGILTMLRKHGEKWAERISPDSLITFQKNGHSATLGQFTVYFSGRTQREAIIGGELPWFEEIPVYKA